VGEGIVKDLLPERQENTEKAVI